MKTEKRMVKIKVHRGTSQIGGTITEISTENTTIFIDFGSELSVSPEESTDQKMVDMICDSKCDAVLFSHYHGDHVGLMGKIPEKDINGNEIKLGIGKVARNILKNIHSALCSDFVEDRKEHEKMLTLLSDDRSWIDFTNKSTFKIGDFIITTVRVDHSAYDAYMFIIEAEGKCIVHTGDFRTHGRLGKKLFPDLEEALKDKTVDILLTEGTMLEREDEEVLSEAQMEDKAYELLKKPENKYAFLVCSSTNVESLASFHNAAMKLGRAFYVNYYVYAQLMEYRKSAGKEDKNLNFWKAYEFENMYYKNRKLGWKTQPEYMLENGFVMLVGKSDNYKYRMDYFKDYNPLLIYSMWDGYVDDPNADTYDKKLAKLYNDWRHEKLHTSGHATVKDIKKLIKVVSPRIGVIPIHTTKGEGFDNMELGEIKVIHLKDGELFHVS